MAVLKVKAFSLIEVLIVIALIAGFMGVTIPNIFRNTQPSLAQAARKISVFTDDLRFISILESVKFYLVFDFEANEVYVESVDAAGLRQKVERFEKITLSENVRLKYFKKGSRFIDAQKAQAVILPFGYIDPFEIVLEENNDQLAFKVLSILGEYTIDKNISPFAR